MRGTSLAGVAFVSYRLWTGNQCADGAGLTGCVRAEARLDLDEMVSIDPS